MASKYDDFWQSKEQQLLGLLAQAASSGRSARLPLDGIEEYGRRAWWQGSVTVQEGRWVGGDNAAHARSLGSLLGRLSLRFPGVRFRATISNDRRLRIRKLSAPDEQTRTTAPLAGHAAGVSAEPPADRPPGKPVADSLWIHKLVWDLLRYRNPVSFAQFPDDGIYFFFEDGEDTTWGPRIVRVGINESRGTFAERLRHHYRGSRRSSVFRLHLGRAILRQSGAPADALADWEGGDSERCQAVEDAVSDALRNRFSFTYIEVPDRELRSRLEAWLIATLSCHPLAAPSPGWLGRWAPAPRIRASGLWNVEHVRPLQSSETAELRRAFESAVERSRRMHISAGRPPGEAPAPGLEPPAPVLVILPCSASKDPPAHPTPGLDSSRRVEAFLRETAGLLRAGRGGKRHVIDWTSPEHPALAYYNGALYRVPGLRRAVAQSLHTGDVEVIILSGGYGVVLADEPIHYYDERMEHAYWIGCGLHSVLEELIAVRNIRAVYAFVARTTAYRKVLEEVNWGRLYRSTALREATIISPDVGGGRGAMQVVPEVLGHAVVRFLNEGCNPAAVFDPPIASGRHRVTVTRL